MPSLTGAFLESRGVSTDSRSVKKGELFFAVKGPSFDGNRFAQQAIEKGASFAVTDDPAVEGERIIHVQDSLQAMQQLAREWRKSFDIPVVAITGTNGKTTTKELVSRVLAAKFRQHSTEGNLNNHIGVPLTLLRMPKGTEIAVIEMGANHVGEIAGLCKIAEPTHGLITNIGLAHLEGFGSPAGVKKAKGELFEWLASHKGTAFVNSGYAELMEMAGGIQSVITYGSGDEAAAGGKILEDLPFLKVKSGKLILDTHLAGRHNFENILAAVCAGRHFGVDDELIGEAISSYIPANNRSQVLERSGNVFIMDAYNANPSNMKLALESLALRRENVKIAILGGMKELGSYSEEEHLRIARFAASLGLSDIILVGEEFRKAADVTGRKFYGDVESLRRAFDEKSYRNTVFLVKGSRLTGLEKLLL